MQTALDWLLGDAFNASPPLWVSAAHYQTTGGSPTSIKLTLIPVDLDVVAGDSGLRTAMASKTASRPGPVLSAQTYEPRFDFDDEDPFASPPPETTDKTGGAGSKRKGAAAELGIDEEVSIQKRARRPNVKLDETV